MAEPAPFSNLQTAEQIAANRALGQKLMMQGMSAEPVQHWTQGLARVLQGGVGRMNVNAADDATQQRQASMLNALQQSPTFAGLSPADRALMGQDPELLRSTAANAFGQKLDPMAALKRQQMQQALDMNPLNRQHLEATTELARAQARAAGQKDAFDQLIMQNFGGGGPPPQPSPVQPQSFVPPTGGTPQAPMPQRVSDVGQPRPDDPALIRTQAGPGQPQPQQPPQAAEQVVQTPMGPMPASKARQFGFLLAYKGKGDAGRMLSEAADPGKMKDAARGELDKGELHAVEQLSRMKAVKDGFDPKFLTLAGHAENLGVSWADYLGMSKDLDPATMKTHQEYVAFHRDVTDNLNRYIKEITGAAMGVDEAKRIIASMPSASDGPAAFQAKMKGVVKATELAVARYRFLRKEGFQGQPWQGTGHDAERAMPVDSFKKIIDRAGDQYEQQFRQANPQGDPKAIQAAVREALKYRFGMSI